jgi:hypothetical protein
MVPKKEERERERRMASFMTAKSTAELKEEIDKVLADDIPDPAEGFIPAFDFDADPPPLDERGIAEDLIDRMDEIEKAKLRDENSQRY